MKKIMAGLLFASIISISGFAQSKSPSDGKVGRAVNKAGNKTAEVAVKGTSSITDKRYKSKEGPHGEAIYINKHSRYYYVDGRGKKVYVAKSRLRDKH